MKRNEVIKALNLYLEQAFRAEGFNEYQSESQAGWYRKSEKGDIFFLDLGYIVRKNPESARKRSYQIEPEINIIIKAVEEIYRAAGQDTEKVGDIEFGSSTIFFREGLLEAYPSGIVDGKEHSYQNWVVHSLEDLESVSKKILTAFQNFVLPYFVKYSNIEAIEKLLNADIDKPVIYVRVLPIRIIKGLIASFLVNRSEYSQLILEYDLQMENVDSVYQERYSRVKQILSKMK